MIIDRVGIHGWGTYELRGPDGTVRQSGRLTNLVTQVGDEYYGERAAGISSPPAQVTGMRLGTDNTTPAKTGTGAAIGAYVTGSAKAIKSGFPTSQLASGKRRITWEGYWAAGEATANGIEEVALTNETPLTDQAGAEADTVARGLLDPPVNKGASDELTVTWNHDLQG